MTAFLAKTGPFELDDERGPMYSQIAETIAAAIEDGRLRPGDRLPAERELAAELKVSRDTVRQALGELQRHGHLVRSVGRAGGTFVARQETAVRLTAPAAEGTARVLRAVERHATPAIAAALEIEPGEYVFEIRRIRSAGGQPVALESLYYPAKRLPGLLTQPLERPLHPLLREVYQERPARAVEYLEPVLAKREEAEALAIEEGVPLIYAERIVFGADGEALEFSRDLMRGDRTRTVVWDV